MEHHFYNAAAAISWLFQLVALPFYSVRLTAYRLMASLSVYAENQLIGAEVKSYANLISHGKNLEDRLADALVDLRSEPARKAAVEAFEHALERMKSRFEQGPPDGGAA